MRLEARWLTEDERRLIVDEAYGLLERVGMRFGASRTLHALEQAGAQVVDREAGVARLPRDLVAGALARCPREVLLAGATPSDDCLLDGSRSHFVPSGAPTHVLDMETGDYRVSTAEDQRQSAIVADAMDVVEVMWMLVAATDATEDERLLRGYATALSWSDKHVQDEITDPWQVEPIVAIMETVCGGVDAFRRRPRFSVVCCTSSPLAIDGAFLDVNVELARYGVPILIYPMPIAGGTAPITVAGTVVINVAEFLGIANLFDATVESLEGATAHLRWNGGLLEAAAVPGLEAGARVRWCIRPGDVMIIRPDRPVRAAIRENQLEGRITDQLPGEALRTLWVELPRPPESSTAEPAPRLEVHLPNHAFQRLDLATGATVRLSLKRTGVRVLTD